MPTTFTGREVVHYEATDPGTAWSKDPWIAIDLDTPLDSERILTPNVIRIPGSGYRLYYTGLGPARAVPDCIGYILSASSRDAVTWVKDPGVRVDVFPPHAALWTLCPDVIPLPDGRYRMYFEARSPDQPGIIDTNNRTHSFAYKAKIRRLRMSRSELYLIFEVAFTHQRR